MRNEMRTVAEAARRATGGALRATGYGLRAAREPGRERYLVVQSLKAAATARLPTSHRLLAGRGPAVRHDQKSSTVSVFHVDGKCGELRFAGEPFFPDLVRHYWRANKPWSGSYFAGTVGGAPLTVVRQYIEQQNRPV